MSDKPERFYTKVSVEEQEGTYDLLLDGRAAKTRNGKKISAQNKSFIEAIAQEWDMQDASIDFESMPLTRYQMTVLDADKALVQEWREEIINYLKSDLLCYRAEIPAALIAQQAALWDPFLKLVEEKIHITLQVTKGIISVEQSQESLTRAAVFLDDLPSGQCLAGRRLTELTGSAVLALSALCGFNDNDAIINAAHLDETFQAEQWGFDKEAADRLAAVAQDIKDTLRFLQFLQG